MLRFIAVALMFVVWGGSSVVNAEKKITAKISEQSVVAKDGGIKEVNYTCAFTAGTNVITHLFSINTESNWMVVSLNDGMVVKGVASSTKIPNTQITHYYLTNGFVPDLFHYDFTVSVNEDGSAAKLSLVGNGRAIECYP